MDYNRQFNNPTMKKNTIIAISILVAVGVVVLAFVIFPRNGVEEARRIDSVTIQKEGNTLTVSREGMVRYETGDAVYEDFWEKDKVDTFFGYINSKYAGEGELITGRESYITIGSGGGTTVYILGDDELVDAVENETGGGGGSPSPTAPPGQSGGDGSPSPTAPPGQEGESSGSSECLYWRLSYCVRPRTPTPTPSSAPAEGEIREPDCDVNTQTGRTVIGNELCLPTPSPTP